jgi:anaerobic selenocysteine-containing dehydrogenase
MLLRLQRGEPIVYLHAYNVSHGIEDHDLVEVWNDVGNFKARAKITNAMHPTLRFSQLEYLP